MVLALILLGCWTLASILFWLIAQYVPLTEESYTTNEEAFRQKVFMIVEAINTVVMLVLFILVKRSWKKDYPSK